jgi:hypothetical protein
MRMQELIVSQNIAILLDNLLGLTFCRVYDMIANHDVTEYGWVL